MDSRDRQGVPVHFNVRKSDEKPDLDLLVVVVDCCFESSKSFFLVQILERLMSC